MDELSKQLKLINKEDIVWYIYFFIITFALITNNLEKNYLLTKNKNSKILAQKINTTILVVAFFIYLYFLSVSLENNNNARLKHNIKDERISFERLIVSLLFLIAGAIAIYADYDDNRTNTDIGIF